MQVLPFPGCCTAGVLTGFGGSSTAAYGYRDDPRTEEQLFDEIGQHLDNCHRRGWAMVFATTTGQQEKANRVLPRIGFQKIDETAKANHREYPLLGWVFRLNPEKEVAPLVVPKNPFGKPRPVDVVPAPAPEALVNPVPQEIRMGGILAAGAIIDEMFGLPNDVRARVRPAPPVEDIPQEGRQIGIPNVERAMTTWFLSENNASVRRVIVQGEDGLWTEIHAQHVGETNPFRRGYNPEARFEYITASGFRSIRRYRELTWTGIFGTPDAIRFYRRVF